jgi:D-glycero-alpha-D-manno-heptose-7-phosphate kinase
VREALLRNNWNEIGRLVNEEWAFRRRNLPTISTPMIDRIIKSAGAAGALAGKVCGAGGGGCVALVIEPDARSRIEAVIKKVGAALLPMKVAREGVEVKVS